MDKHVDNVTTSGTAPGESPAEGRKQALASLLSALRRGEADEVVRVFTEAQAQHRLPKGIQIAKWLIKHIGKQAMGKLVMAFAGMRCFNCEAGTRECENCGGAGHFDYEMICEACLGLGIVPCDFCAGSGRAPIDSVPPGLRSAVFAVRLRRAERRVKRILEQKIPRPRGPNASDVLCRKARIVYLF